jgi:hypothetical protein
MGETCDNESKGGVNLKQKVVVKTVINSVVECTEYPVTENFDEDYADYLRDELENFLLNFDCQDELSFRYVDISDKDYKKMTEGEV